MNSTICLTNTPLVTRVVVGSQLEEEPRIIDPYTRTATVRVSCVKAFVCMYA